MGINRTNDKNELITNRILTVFTSAFVYICLLMMTSSFISRGTTFLTGLTMVQVIMGVSIVAIIAGVVLHTKKTLKGKVVTGFGIMVAGLISTLSMLAIYLNVQYHSTLMTLIYAVVAGVAIIHMIFHIYNREFYVIVLSGFIGGMTVWIQRAGTFGESRTTIIAVAGIILIGVVAYYGMNSLKRYSKLPKSTPFKTKNGMIMNVTAIVMTLAIVITHLLGASVSLYVLIAMLVYLFALAVFYTVKLI